MCARDQSSIFSTGGKFRSDYGLLLELHALTLVAYSYALLHDVVSPQYMQHAEVWHLRDCIKPRVGGELY